MTASQLLRTFFVTSNAYQHRSILQSENMASLLLEVLYENRAKQRISLHEFVIMPNHFHLLIMLAADIALEKVIQFVKGGFSYRAKKELGFKSEIWQVGFTNHRIRDAVDYDRHRSYIHQNPVAARLVERPELFRYSSAFPGAVLDAVPPWLKPVQVAAARRGG